MEKKKNNVSNYTNDCSNINDVINNNRTIDQTLNIYFPYGEHPYFKPIEFSEFEDVYIYDSVKDNLIKTDEQRHIQEEITAYLDGTRIYDILDKYVGINSSNFIDIPELNKKSGMYVDISDLPDNLHDLQKLSIAAKQQLKDLENGQVQEVNKNAIGENSKDNGKNQNEEINKKDLQNNRDVIEKENK